MSGTRRLAPAEWRRCAPRAGWRSVLKAQPSRWAVGASSHAPPQEDAPLHRGAGRYGGEGGGAAAAPAAARPAAAAEASPGAERFFGRANERLYEAYSQLHTMAQDFDKPFDSPAILVVGHQTDGKSGARPRL